MKIPSEAQWQRNTLFIPHLNTHLSIWGGAGFDRWVYKANSTQREQEREREIDWGKRHQRDTQSWDGVTYWATEACQLSNHKAEDGQQQTCAAKMPDHTTKRRPVPSWSDFFLPQPGQPVQIRFCLHAMHLPITTGLAPGPRSSTVTHLIWTWAMQVQWYSFKYCGVLWNYHGSAIIQYSIYGIGTIWHTVLYEKVASARPELHIF